MLNAANAARLFYADAHTPQTQSSEFWTGDPQSSVAYEGLRHHWLGGEFDGEEQYAAGDPLTYGWGPQTDFGIYGSAVSGVFGSIIKTTNVDKILQLDLLATDFYHDTARSTYLYYNPYRPRNRSRSILAAARRSICTTPCRIDIWRGATGQTFFNVPSDEAVMLVLVPSGGAQTRQGRRLLVDGVVVDYNATLLPDNLVRNPDVDSANPNDANRPSFWHYSTECDMVRGNSAESNPFARTGRQQPTGSEEWRSYATALDRRHRSLAPVALVLEVRHRRRSEFRARLRLSNDDVTSLDLTNPLLEYQLHRVGFGGRFRNVRNDDRSAERHSVV